MTKHPTVASNNYEAEDDARTLTRAQEVRGNAKRHAAACKCLKKNCKDTKGALSMEQKAADGLKEVFGKSENE